MLIELNTQRLILRPVSLNDINDVHALLSTPEVDEFNTLGIPDSILQTEMIVHEWIANHSNAKGYVFSICNTASNEFIGLIGINLGKPNFRLGEVWYKTHPRCWNNGYTTEALHKILAFGFNDLQLHRIEAGCAIGNLASIKVLEKVGMLREGSKRKVLPIRGNWVDNYLYAILDTDYPYHS